MEEAITDAVSAFDKIQSLIVDKDPDDNDKFLREIWDIAQETKEILTIK